MEILKPDMTHLRNEEHYQFGGEFNEIIVKSDVATLQIGAQFALWTTCYRIEGMSLQKITKSAYTEYIGEAAGKRDRTFRGMVDVNRGMMNHYDDKTKTAASQLQIVFDTYGNIPGKPLTEKTGSYDNLIEEMRSPAQIENAKALGFMQWIDELDKNNKEVFQLMQQRNDETAGKPLVSVKEARRQVDEAYEGIMQRIAALLIVDGETNAERKEAYESFIRKHNAAVARYNNAIAARRGRSGNGEEPGTGTEGAEA